MGFCPNTHLHCHLCLFLSEMKSLFFLPVTLFRSVLSLVGGTGLASAGGCCHRDGQGVSPPCFGGALQHSGSAEVKLVVRDFAYNKA